jgi:hypothetical protein
MRRCRRQRGRHAACGGNPRAAWTHRGDATVHEARRFALHHKNKAKRASSPPCLGRRCGGSCFATSHNGLLIEVAPFARKARSVSPPLRPKGLAPFGFDQPPLCLAPRSACSAASRVRLAALEHRSSCGHGLRRHRKHQSQAPRCGAVMVLAPARHPSAPRGGLPGFVEASRSIDAPQGLPCGCKPPESARTAQQQRIEERARQGQAAFAARPKPRP